MPLSPALQQAIEKLQLELNKAKGDFRKKLSTTLFQGLSLGGPKAKKQTGDVKEEFEIIATSIGTAHEKGEDEPDPFKEKFFKEFLKYFETTEITELTKGGKEVKIFTIIEKADHPEFKVESVEAADEDLGKFNAQQKGWLLAKCLSSGGKTTNIIKLVDLQNAQLTTALTSATLTWKEKTDDGLMVERIMSNDEALELIDYALTRLDSDKREYVTVSNEKAQLLRKKRELLGEKIPGERSKKLGIVDEIQGKVLGIDTSTLNAEQKAIIESLVKAARGPDAAVSLQKKAQKLDDLMRYTPKEKLTESFSKATAARMSGKKAELEKTLQGQGERIKSLIAMEEIELLFNDLANPNLNAEEKAQIIGLLQLYETGSAGNPFQIVGITYHLPKGLKAIEPKYVSLLPSTSTKGPLSQDATSLYEANKKIDERSAIVNQGALSALISLSFFQDRADFNKQDYSAVGSSAVREAINGIKKSLNLAGDHQAIKSFDEFFTNTDDFSRAAFINQVSLTLFQVLASDKKFDTCLAQLKQKPALLKLLGIDGVFLEHKLVKETIATALKDDELDGLRHRYDWISTAVRDNFINFRNRVNRHELFLETTKDEDKDEEADPAINNIEKMDIYTALNDEGKKSELEKFFTDLKIATLQPVAEIPIAAFVAREVKPSPEHTPDSIPAPKITIADLGAKLKELKTKIDSYALASSEKTDVIEANEALRKAEAEEKFATDRAALIRQITECIKRVSIQALEKEAGGDQIPERNTTTVLSQLLREIMENQTGSIKIAEPSKHQVTIGTNDPLEVSRDFTATLVELVNKQRELKGLGLTPLVINTSDLSDPSSKATVEPTLDHKNDQELEKDSRIAILEAKIKALESAAIAQKLEKEAQAQELRLEIERLGRELSEAVSLKSNPLPKKEGTLVAGPSQKAKSPQPNEGAPRESGEGGGEEKKGEGEEDEEGKSKASDKTESCLINAIELIKLYPGDKISLSKETFGERGKSNPVLEARHIKKLVDLVLAEPTRLNGSMYGGLTFDFKDSDPKDIRRFLQSISHANFRSCTIKNLDLEAAFAGSEEEKGNILKNFSEVIFTNCKFESHKLSGFRFKVKNILNDPESSNGLNPEVDISSPSASPKITEAKKASSRNVRGSASPAA